MIRHHPPEDRLAAYAAGAPGAADALLVASHLVLCPDCRARVADYEALGGMMLEELPAEAMADGSLERALAQIQPAPEPPPPPRLPAAAPGSLLLPRPVCNLVGQDMDRLPWRGVGPGFHFHRLPVPGRAWLIRIAPGRAVPHHGHASEEMVLVLAGSYRDGAARYARGDVQVVGPETRHRPVAEPGQECLCLAVIEGPLRFSNPLGRLIGPLFGF